MNQTARQSSILRELTPEESTSLKKCILVIFKAVSAVCDEFGLTYMLAGGSCLGSVRHKGFIPWDDDLDIMMPRTDYEVLLLLLKQGKLGEEFSYSYPDGKMESPVSFLKVYKNNTVLVGLTDGKNCPYPQKVFIDIFPMDGVPSRAVVRRIKGIIADFLRIASNTVYDSRAWSDVQKQFYSSIPEMERTIRIRRYLGKLLSIIPHKKWVCWFDHFVKDPRNDHLVGIPTGRKCYRGEIFESSVYLPTTYGIFEGLKVPLPREWDVYLKNLYSDYHILPPHDQRERHFILKVEIPHL